MLDTEVLKSMSYGVYIVSAMDGERPTGCLANSVMQIDSDVDLIGTFGFCSGKNTDKFAHVDYEMVQGVPVVRSTCGYAVCKVADKMVTDTHIVFLGEVIATGIYEGMGEAMTYAYYGKVIKG